MVGEKKKVKCKACKGFGFIREKRLDGALKETQYALQYVEEDMRGNHEFLQMAMIRTLKAIEQVLKGGA
ncbi:hypothetical protein AS584_18835 [Acinetobacter baumannii]|uniref:hypothetical protein n=1 Tax=Acinetobacter baumannii TaxID=470 RepID=UPI000BDA414F|nr:hypothetical protein [Acinetobacter baumannii]PCN94504.1 hypothetical protein AS584_18835 [Acinetobacter baumannii]